MVEASVGIAICIVFGISLLIPLSLICLLYLLIWSIFHGISSFFGFIISFFRNEDKCGGRKIFG